MKRGRMQAKDIPDAPILAFLAKHHPQWCFRWSEHERGVPNAMPPDTPEKLALAKMKSLVRRGLVDGCCCGCRGDFTLTTVGAVELRIAEQALRSDPPPV